MKFLIWIPFFLVSGVVFAAGGGSHGDPMIEFAYKVLNFAILVLLLFLFARKPIKNMLKSSVENTKSEIDEAREKAQEAEGKLTEYREKLANMEKSIETMKDEAIADAEKEKEKIIADAKAFAVKLEEQAQFQVEQSIVKAKAEIREFLAEEAVKMAETAIKGNQANIDQQALLNDYASVIKEAK